MDTKDTKNTKNDTIINALGRIVDNPTNFFRNVLVIGIEKDNGLFGRADIQEFNSPENFRKPSDLVFTRKFVFTAHEGVMSGLIVTNGPMDPVIATTITRSVNPRKVNLPKDGHVRWQTCAPDTGMIIGYLTHLDKTLVLDPRNLPGMNLKSDEAIDMQMVYSPVYDKYVVHVLTRMGFIHSGYITPSDVTHNNTPEFARVDDGANALLTIPRNNEVIPIIGTDNGIVIAGAYLDTTKGMKITGMAIDSEANLIFFRTANKIFALRYDNDLRAIDRPMLVSDNADTLPWMLSGQALNRGDKRNIILSGASSESDGHYNFTKKVVSYYQPTA